jgi:probable HAF family extracellular repeat protein
MKTSRLVHLAMFAMAVFGGVETASANPIYSFTTINVPGSFPNSVVASGINDSGQIVGGFNDSLGTHGFLDTGGSFTTIDVPFGGITFASGINDSGQIVGGSSLGAFVDTGGSFTFINVPGANFTEEALGINNSGQIVGVFNDTLGLGVHGFLDTGGNFTTIDVPFGGITFAFGINDSGQIVGYSLLGAFLDTGGSFSTIAVPGAMFTTASGINNSGQIVGDFIDNLGIHGFVDTGGSFTTIDVPGAIFMEAFGINDSGQIVGLFTDAGGDSHGFLATPVATPEPPSLITLATCLVALFGIACFRRRARAGNRNT